MFVPTMHRWYFISVLVHFGLSKDDKPTEVVSERNIMELRLHTDADGVWEGFTVEFTETELKTGTVTSCGGTIELGDDLAFPEHSEIYGKDVVDCTWTITAPVGYVMEAKFLRARVTWEADNILDPRNAHHIKVWPLAQIGTGKYCGDDDGTPLARVISSERTMNVQLYTGWSHGFIFADFTAVKPEATVVQ